MGASGRPDRRPRFVPRHADEEEYRRFLSLHHGIMEKTRHIHLADRVRFVEAYPNLDEWLAAPLDRRVGRILRQDGSGGELSEIIVDKASYKARSYLYFLATRGYLRFDWKWLVAMRRLPVWDYYFKCVGLDVALEQFIDEAAELDYSEVSARAAGEWILSRIYMHTLEPHLRNIGEAQIADLEEAVVDFGRRPDLELFYGLREKYAGFITLRKTHLHLFRVVLYHRGQLPDVPRKGGPPLPERPVLKPQMEEAARRYADWHRAADRRLTAERTFRGLRAFISWLAESHPEIESFADIDREVVLEYAEALSKMIVSRTGRPLAPSTKTGRLIHLSNFFRDTAEWGWQEVPGRQLLGRGDFPRKVHRVPRYIPKDELDRLMEVIRSLECSYQRTALLVTRWSGARRDEVRRLEVDCLDYYPDGMPRLRIPASKTYEERVIPLNEEAAREIHALREISKPGRGLRDSHTGKIARYLFTRQGQLLSTQYLFDIPLREACSKAGLVTEDGKPTISAHRFRHTVGTQLAEKDARLQTIMSVLGHQSPHMSMVYAQISDKEVRRDYEAVLGPGAAIAGPLAETLRSGKLPDSDIAWLKTNFFKTELELGHCLRLPQEGPCECDLYLTCAKFVTTKEYAPRLRARREREFELIEDAISNGWEREVERHRCTVKRIEQLLTELGEPLEAEEDVG